MGSIVIGQTILHYHILEKLGQGGMGVVYKAEDIRLERFVALKFLPHDLTRDAQAVERFMQEAQKASALDHQNICTIHQFSETDDGQMFMVMAYYNGETLLQRIENHQFDIDDMTVVIKQLCDGLSQTHKKGIVHRDIKPANIIFASDDVLKILDFGLAKLAGHERLTKQHSTLGTIAYMSPEQLAGDPIDNRVDLWSVGVIMYEMLTGRRSFRGEIEQAVIYSILNEEPDPISKFRNDVPAYIERIILKALEKEPDDRYVRVDEIINDLHVFASPILKIHQKQKSIVVLPFDDMSSEIDQGYISDGLTEEIIADLSQLRELRVISRSSAMAFKDQRKDIQKIRRQLDVQYVLEGSVRKSGDNLRITAQLIDAKNDSHLWAEKYSGGLEDIFDMQERVSRSILEALKIKLAPVEDKKIAHRPISNVCAYECYLRARQFLWYFKEDLLRRAEDEVTRALQLTGPNELLFATLGWIYHQYVEIGVQTDVDYHHKAEESVQKAFALNHNSESGFALSGALCYRRGDLQLAVIDFKKALAINPQNPDALQMFVYCAMLAGHGKSVLPSIDLLDKVDPMNAISVCMHGFYFCMEGQFAEGLPFYVKMYNISSENPAVRFFYAWVLAWNKKNETALDVLDQIVTETPDAIFATLAYIMKYALLGEKDKALSFFTPDVLGASEHVEAFARFLMEFYAYLGEKEKAMNWAEKAIQRGFINYPFFAKHSRFLKSIRAEKRFQRILNDVKVRWENFQA
jgi:eukaryotic-like serine/threonine-protein kinase